MQVLRNRGEGDGDSPELPAVAIGLNLGEFTRVTAIPGKRGRKPKETEIGE